jgi:ribonuclease P protein component
MKESLTKQERLKKSKDIQQVFSEGRKTSCPGMRLYWVENGLSWNRIAVTLSKKFGNAVTRNKTKRHIREIYRKLKKNLGRGYDFIVLAFPKEYSFSERKEQMISLFRKAGLFGGIRSNS